MFDGKEMIKSLINNLYISNVFVYTSGGQPFFSEGHEEKKIMGGQELRIVSLR